MSRGVSSQVMSAGRWRSALATDWRISQISLPRRRDSPDALGGVVTVSFTIWQKRFHILTFE